MPSGSSKHVVIIGAGVIGLSTAYYCALRGHRVTVLDRKGAERDGCSFGNAGMIVPSHFVPLAAPGMVALGLRWMWNPESPFFIRPRLDADLLSWAWKFWRAANRQHVARSAPLLRDLSFASRACFEELAQVPDLDFDLTTKGLLMLCKTAAGLEHEAAVAEQARELGVPAEILDPRRAAALDPALQMDIAGAVFFPRDAHLSPSRFMAGLQRELVRLGVSFCWESEVAGFVRRGSRVEAVRTADTEIAADEIVLCGGSWSPEIGRELGLKLPMQAGKGYSLTLPDPPRLPRLCSICTEARIAVTPMGGALRFGGTMEICGMDESISARRVRGIIRAVPDYFPEFGPRDFENIQPWSGLRPCSPDGLPFLGRTAACTNLVVATGHGMMGLSLGPITGRLVSELVSDAPPSTDLTLLSPDRWS